MIFDCPRCEAENAIPVTDIPPEGKVAMCGGCKQPFRVLPPDPDEVDEAEDSLGFEGNAETTTVGAPPAAFEDANEDPTGGFFIPPSHTPEPPLIARNTSDLPPEIIGGGSGATAVPIDTSATLGAAAELSGADDTLLPGDGRTHGRRLRSRNPADDRTPPSGSPAVSAAPPARAAPTPAVVPLPPAPPPSQRRWFARVPLAAKVGAAVFPIALVVAVLIRPGGASHGTAPIALPVAPRPTSASATVAVAAVATASPAAASTAAASPRPALDPQDSPLTHDRPAKDGYLFVAADNVMLRSRAGGGGAPIEPAKRGTLVRVVERVEGAVLVWVEPVGPVGFALASNLDARMPISLLADKVAIDGCSERATCAEAARVGGTRCIESCAGEGAADQVARARCREACSLARSRCERSCEAATKPNKDPKKKAP